MILENYLDEAPRIRWLGITEALINAGRVSPKTAKRYISAIRKAKLDSSFSSFPYWQILDWLVDTYGADSRPLLRFLEIHGSLVPKRHDADATPRIVNAAIGSLSESIQSITTKSDSGWNQLQSGIENASPVVRRVVGQAMVQGAKNNSALIPMIQPLLDDADQSVCQQVSIDFANTLPESAADTLEALLATAKHPREIEAALRVAKKSSTQR